MSDTKALIRRLQETMNQTLDELYAMPDAVLEAHSEHTCARGGNVRDLITHMIDHERMHLGSVVNDRAEVYALQQGQVHRLLAEWFRDRAMVVAALIGLPDEALDKCPTPEEWSIREIVDHLIYWERDAAKDAATHAAAHADMRDQAAVVGGRG